MIDPFPKDIKGLVGRYTVDSATATAWNDVSGANNHATEVIGSLKVDDIDFIYGTKDDGVKFPQNFKSSGYTLFYVANYNGSTMGRIFDGNPENWLSGFHSGHIGVAYHTNAWLSHDYAPGIYHRDGWIMGSDSKDMYRVNGMDMNNLNLTTYPQGNPTTISINYGKGREWGTELSDWAVKEVILYNRELSLAEVEQVEAYLSSTYGINKGDGVTPGMVDNGYFTSGITEHKAGGLQNVTVEKCREAAVTAGAHGFGYRKDTHEIPELRGSCFLYGTMYDNDGNRDATWNWFWDNNHSMHCTDPKGIVQDACQVPT
jgi:hypothetical protein